MIRSISARFGRGREPDRAPATPRIRRRTARPRPFRVLTVCSNKGGVGKTTVSTNLAVYLKALTPDLPVLALGLDDQSALDRLFAAGEADGAQTVETALRAGSFAGAIRQGRYGVHYVPSSAGIARLKGEIGHPLWLHAALEETGWRGLVVVDTKSDLEVLTRNAIASSDLAVVPVKGEGSLREAGKVFELLERWAWPRERARVLLSMIDLRIKYRGEDARDVLSLLRAEIERLDYPAFASYLSRSPKIESLATNPDWRAVSILHGATGSLVHRQMLDVARETLELLGIESVLESQRRDATPPPSALKRWLLSGGPKAKPPTRDRRADSGLPSGA